MPPNTSWDTQSTGHKHVYSSVKISAFFRLCANEGVVTSTISVSCDSALPSSWASARWCTIAGCPARSMSQTEPPTCGKPETRPLEPILERRRIVKPAARMRGNTREKRPRHSLRRALPCSGTAAKGCVSRGSAKTFPKTCEATERAFVSTPTRNQYCSLLNRFLAFSKIRPFVPAFLLNAELASHFDHQFLHGRGWSGTKLAAAVQFSSAEYNRKGHLSPLPTHAGDMPDAAPMRGGGGASLASMSGYVSGSMHDKFLQPSITITRLAIIINPQCWKVTSKTGEMDETVSVNRPLHARCLAQFART